MKALFKVRVPASTSNLGPGFDTLGLALSLYNTIEVYRDKGFSIKGGKGDRECLFLKSFKITLDGIRAEDLDVRIIIRESIPWKKGLGSSAVAIIGGIVTALRLQDRAIDKNMVLNSALKLEFHPDNITPTLLGGFTISSIRNGEVIYKKFSVRRKIHVILVLPDLDLSTKEARKVLPDSVPFKDACFNINHTALLVACLANGDIPYSDLFFDYIHQPYRESFIPGFDNIIHKGYKGGAFGCFLSGAGPSIIALTEHNSEGIGEAMVRSWKDYGVRSNYMILRIDNNGTIITYD